MATDKEKDNKLSVYLKDKSVRTDIELLSQLDDTSMTDIITTALTAYFATRQDDLDLLHEQQRQREEHKKNKESLQAKQTE